MFNIIVTLATVPCIHINQSVVEEDAVTIQFYGSSETFSCQLDGGTTVLCTSPVTYTNLSTGLHMVNVTGASGCMETTEFNIACK